MANRNGRTLPEIPLMETGERDHFKAAKYELKNKNISEQKMAGFGTRTG